MPLLSQPVKPDYEEFLRVILREGTPRRVHHIELFHDGEVAAAIRERYDIGRKLSQDDPHYHQKLDIEFKRFLGFDWVWGGPEGFWPGFNLTRTDDTAGEMGHKDGRSWMAERGGPIQTWEDFEKYPWDEFFKLGTANLEWLSKNLPDDMMIMGSGMGQFCEYLCWYFGYESLCYALCEQRDLVLAMKEKIEKLFMMRLELMLQFNRVKAVFGADDLGFKTGLLLGTRETRELILPGHKKVADRCHAAGRPYILHACGNLNEIIDDFINDVHLDGKHSYEDTIEDVREVKHTYGRHMALLGGIDVDFLCRSDEQAIRKRVRETIEICNPGGGWCLGTGNSVANYIPLENYLSMLDEGRKH